MSTMSEAAEVDSALLAAYGKALAECLDGPREQVGERLIRTFLTSWEDPRLRPQLIEVFRSAFTSDAGATLLRDFMSSRLFARVAEKLKVPPSDIKQAAEMLKVPPLNFNAAAAQVWGVVVVRYVLKIEPIASASVDELVDLLAPTIQRYLGGYSVPVSPTA
jgi:tetracycline repressor-like protein